MAGKDVGFALLRLPKEILGELTSFLHSAAVTRLWTTGDARVIALLSASNVVRVLRCSSVRKDGKDWTGRLDLLNRFPYLRILAISARESSFSVNMPPIYVSVKDLPPTLTSFRLVADNSLEVLVDPAASSDGQISYHDIGAKLPMLQVLDLTASIATRASYLPDIHWPETLTTVILSKVILTHNELARMPPQLTSISICEITYPPNGEELAQLGANLEVLNVASRDYVQSGDQFISHFELLPPHIKHLRLNHRGHVPDSSIRALPASLTWLDLPSSSFDVKLVSSLINLERLSFEARATPPNISQFLPRKLSRLSMRHYDHMDDDFWIGLPRGLSSLSTLNFTTRPRMMNPGQGQSVMTSACIPHIPPLLQTLDLTPITEVLSAESVSQISGSVVRLKLLSIESDAMAQLASSVKNLELTRATLTEDWVKVIPPKVDRLRITTAVISEPISLSLFSPTLTDLKISYHRSEDQTIFTPEMVSYLPHTLLRLSIRSINEMKDDFIAAIKIPGLNHLELRSDAAAFTDAAIAFIPRQLGWLDLYGCDAWTYSPESLLMLPRTLTWCYIHFRDHTTVKLLPISQITPHLPRGLEHHNIPSVEKPPGQFW